jgi:hypothetical protein
MGKTSPVYDFSIALDDSINENGNDNSMSKEIILLLIVNSEVQA